MGDITFAHFATRSPHTPAILEAGGRSTTRGQLYEAMNRISRAMRAAGIGEGDVVAILAPNCTEFVAVYMAATQIGAYVVTMNWHLAPAEIAYILASSKARALFTHQRLARLTRAVMNTEHFASLERIAIGSVEGFTSIDAFTASHEAGPIENPSVGRPLMYTSATTGRPKAISLPLADAATTRERTIRHFISCGIEPDREIHLAASMLYHAGPIDFLATSLHLGHTIVLVDRWEPQELLELIQKHRVTTSLMVPTMFVRLLKLPIELRKQYDTGSLKYVLHTAAPCPIETKRSMLEWWGPVLVDGYGAAEGVGTSATSQDWQKYPGTVGRPVPGSKIRILDENGNELPAGTIGTIYLTRFQGDRFEYKDDPEKTRAAYRGEFFTVGDMGYLNEEGYLFICDRRIDMIICGGMNIYPAEIEHILVQHPRIADCAVFGVPDEVMGEAIQAAVQLLPGEIASASLTADIMAFLRQQLSASKIPRRIEFVTDLPRDPNGKLFKRVLRESHWRGHVNRV